MRQKIYVSGPRFFEFLRDVSVAEMEGNNDVGDSGGVGQMRYGRGWMRRGLLLDARDDLRGGMCEDRHRKDDERGDWNK